MANEMQRGNLTGTAIMRMPISGTVSIGGKQMKELRFMPYSEFPEEGREDVLYIDTDGNAMYYWNGTEYIALSGGGSGGTSNYNELSNKPSINDITLTGNKTSADLGLQPTISDLATIRSGAASGATAVQPSDMETALASKQDVIDDLSDIRTGAAAGETAVQPSALETALSGKQDVISDLDAIRSGATAGNTALQPEDIDTLPTDGSSNPVSSGGTYNFVNSSIATNTAYFIGTFASVAELEAYSGTVTNNDYAFVTSTDSAGNTLYNRYKYNAATLIWSFEYAVNNTAFTAAQWAAIQSGMTSAEKTKLDGIEQGANKTVIDASPTSGSSNAVSSGGVYTALSGKQDTISDLSTIRSGASAGATAVQPAALSDYQTKLSGTNKLDPAYINYDSTHAAVTDSDKTTWSGKQDAINDLSTIRSGSEAGATAVQTIQIDGTAQTKTNGVVNLPAYPTTLPASDTTSTYSSSGTAPVNGTAVKASMTGTLSAFDADHAATSKAVADSQAAQDAEIAWNVNQGVKNLIELSPNTYTSGNVVVKLNDDGTVSVSLSSGSTANTTFSRAIKTITNLRDMDLILNGCPSGGNYSSGYALYISDNSTTKEKDEGNGVLVPKNTTVTTSYLALIVRSGTAISGTLTFKPMLRSASITDSTFQPYSLPNPTLTPAVIKAVDEGAKNLLQLFQLGSSNANVGNPCTSQGVEYKIQSNGTITAYRKSSASAGAYIFLYKNGAMQNVSEFFDGNHIWSGNPPQYPDGGVSIWYKIGSGSNITLPNGALLPNANGEAVQIGFQISTALSPTQSNPIVFKPMICTASDWAVSQKFEPYALSNPVITPALIEQVDNGAKNHLYCDMSVMKSANTNGTWSGSSFAHNSGVTFTINNDSSITVNGTASDVNGVFVLSTDFTISQGDWILSGTPNGGSSSTYNITIAGVISDIGVTARFNSATNKLVRIYVLAGTTANNLLFKPMICSAADYAISPAFVPYALTNQELTSKLMTDEAALAEMVDNGAKNFLTENTKTETGQWTNIPVVLKAGSYVLSIGALSSTDTDATKCQLGLFNSANQNLLGSYPKLNRGNNIVYSFEISSESAYLRIYSSDTVAHGTGDTVTVTNAMLCTAADWAVSQKFVPYCPTNRELYEMIQALQNA